MRAFLSHSHVDSELVQSVANRLGRPFVAIDMWTFRTGDDLIEAMERAVRESAVFVLFASRASLDSVWVQFEQQQARFYQATSRILKTITVLLDDRLSPTDLPQWLLRTRYLQSRAPGPIARAIREAIDELVQDEQHRLFVGRARETSDLQAAFVPPDTSSEPPLVVLRGLPGIGRRTLLRRVASDSLGIARILTLRIERGDDINSIAIKLADLVEPVSTPDETLATAVEIQSLPRPDALDRFIRDIEIAQSLNELVVLYDAGGLLTNDGGFAVGMHEMVASVASRPGLAVAAVTNRRPNWADAPELAESEVIDVRQLTSSEVRQLLALTARAYGVELSPSHIAALVDQVRGYPPAAAAAIQLVKTYGPDLAIGAARQAAAYQPRPLNRYLASLDHNATERRLLAILARNSPLPLEVLAEFAPDADEAERAIRDLIDASLVEPQIGTSFYHISEPVIDFIDREYAQPTIEEYSQLARSLERVLAEADDEGPYLDVSRVFYRSLMHAGDEMRPRAFALVADWLHLAEQFYHQRHYERALAFAEQAYDATGSSDALTWIIRSKVKLGEYPSALEAIDRLRSVGDVRDAHFFRGFLERNRGDHRAAIKHYELAKQAGRGGLALERDLAECYYQIGELESAEARIRDALERQFDNPYVVSLRIKIACKRRDEQTARDLLPLLDQVDDPGFAAHRHSRVELVFGDVGRAYEHAKRAAELHVRPASEILSNLALCEIRTGRLSDAKESIEKISRLYGRQQPDLILGLRTRAALAERRYEDALGYTENFARADNPVHLALRREALQGLLNSTNMPRQMRTARERAVAELESKLISQYGGVDWDVELD